MRRCTRLNNKTIIFQGACSSSHRLWVTYVTYQTGRPRKLHYSSSAWFIKTTMERRALLGVIIGFLLMSSGKLFLQNFSKNKRARSQNQFFLRSCRRAHNIRNLPRGVRARRRLLLHRRWCGIWDRSGLAYRRNSSISSLQRRLRELPSSLCRSFNCAYAIDIPAMAARTRADPKQSKRPCSVHTRSIFHRTKWSKRRKSTPKHQRTRISQS